MKRIIITCILLSGFYASNFAITHAEAAQQLMQVFQKIKNGTSTQSEVQQAINNASKIGVSWESYAKKVGITTDEVRAALNGEGTSQPRRHDEEEARKQQQDASCCCLRASSAS